MKPENSKFILTTKSLFTTSFILFSIMSFFYTLSFLNIDYFLPFSFLDFATVVFFFSTGFYILMPFIRFIVNFRKIETEAEKESVSGFYKRYFGGFLVSLILVLLFLPLNIGGLDRFYIFGIIGLFIFYYFSINSLSTKK